MSPHPTFNPCKPITCAGVHGWGIFARKSIPHDTPLFEYRGDSVRSLVADLREARYRVEGRDCYLFRLNDDAVLDATTLGSISRFTNHCCQPSLYTRVRPCSSRGRAGRAAQLVANRNGFVCNEEGQGACSTLKLAAVLDLQHIPVVLQSSPH